jgi:hypothetical protein
MDSPIILCSSCGVPCKECMEEGKNLYDRQGNGDYVQRWICAKCSEDSNIRCSHCNDIIKRSLPEPLDDGSFLCKECDTKLLEELDEFTNNNKPNSQ